MRPGRHEKYPGSYSGLRGKGLVEIHTGKLKPEASTRKGDERPKVKEGSPSLAITGCCHSNTSEMVVVENGLIAGTRLIDLLDVKQPHRLDLPSCSPDNAHAHLELLPRGRAHNQLPGIIPDLLGDLNLPWCEAPALLPAPGGVADQLALDGDWLWLALACLP